MLDPWVFVITRIVVFFVATAFIFNGLKAVNFEKIFRPNSSGQIRLLIMVLSIVLGYLFADTFVSLFESVNNQL
ncbi:MAG TPA: DUF1146 domain-containing protein [Bacillota bacterium]|nr:DUF1146 domain-containing protein [Bacillota bacterium]HPF42585.1 DUF1146 domain-containing protein [Bacillota bacterium]HPJ86052.1 DUF1146 domain-containing protein [Bacillota bacterium]HPQ62105.1 DUF1146 domain-containing protein [Bacillota bacterium]HRX91517.1 DUF1146 domain-containing protein [Candidatus Izemoplasmatales bacterium]